MKDVLLRGRQPAVTGSGHETSGMNQVVSTRLFLQELKNLFRYFPVSLNATDVSVSRGVYDGDGVRNGHSFLVVDGVGRHGAGLTVRLIPGAGFVFADALEAERILPLDSEDVVDHPVDECALPASGGAHKDDVFVIWDVAVWSDVEPAEICVGRIVFGV